MMASLLFISASVAAPAGPAESASPATIEWFQATEQALLDAIARGDRTGWDRVMDPSCVVTTEEGEVLTKEQFLELLRPLPEGLKGAIVVRDLSVKEYGGFALVRFLADESETVFGQRLAG